MRISDWSSDVCSSDLDSELAASAGRARHLRLAEAGRARARRARHRTALYRGVMLIGRQAQFLLLQLSDLVTQTGGLLELKVARCFPHPLFKIFDIGAQIMADEI